MPSGCSLGPEGPSVEIGAGISRMASGGAASLREKHHLFLAGTAAGVSAGELSTHHSRHYRHHDSMFWQASMRPSQVSLPLSLSVSKEAAILLYGILRICCGVAGVFFAIECGNRYLSKNTIRLDEDAPDGPRADIAAIVLAAAFANLVSDTLFDQGCAYIC